MRIMIEVEVVGLVNMNEVEEHIRDAIELHHQSRAERVRVRSMWRRTLNLMGSGA